VQFLVSVLAWLADPARWQGTDGIPNRVGEHIWLSGLAVLVAVLLAAPIGVWLGHRGRGGFLAVNVTNLGRALPSMALLAFALPVTIALGLGLGFWPTLVALVPLGIPPILTNCYTAVRGVDPDVVEAGRGVGLSEWQVLRGVELPIAAPLIMAGIRNAAVAIVATATLGALVAGGGLGRYIVDGLALQDYQRLFVGALLVALLAIVTEVLFGLLERGITSPEVRGGPEQAARPATA
jgi:osmoprotectant transport system permease protein